MKRFITLISLLTILAIFGSACSGAMEPAPAPSAAPAPTADFAVETPTPAPAPASAPAPSAPAVGGEAAQQQAEVDDSVVALMLLTPSDSRGRRLVYTVDMELQTTQFMQGRRTILNTAARLNGYVESANVNGRDMRSPWTERRAGFTLRIHSDNLAEFLVVMEDEFNLVSFNQVSNDVTSEFEHVEATIDDLREQEERLRDLLENADLNDTERRNLNRQLADIQANIRNRERQRNVFDDHVHYSTVNIRLFEVIFPEDVPEPESEPELSFGARFSEAAGNMATGFVRVMQAIAIGIISILPALVVLAVIVVIVIIVCRKAKKENNKSNDNDNNHTPPNG